MRAVPPLPRGGPEAVVLSAYGGLVSVVGTGALCFETV
jgi:hypothetical protein